jgi:hypothetical protein
MKPPVRLCIHDLQLFNQSVDFHEIQQVGLAIEDNLDAIICNPIALTILR